MVTEIKEIEKLFNEAGFIIEKREPRYCGRTRSIFPTNWVLKKDDTEFDEDYSKNRLISRNLDLIKLKEAK